MHRLDDPVEKGNTSCLGEGHLEDELTMDQLRQERLKFICREQDLEGTNSKPQAAVVAEAPEAVRRRRKSHPWKTDLKLNRFGAPPAAAPPAATSRTQKSTLFWKQRMQERKAVFGNVAVLEDANGEGEEEEEEEESIGANEDEINNEAYEMLKNRGFEDLPPPPPPTSHTPPTSARSLQQEILQQHYEDDLLSVGPGESLASSQNTTEQRMERLNEIQSLRQQILERRNRSQQLSQQDQEDAKATEEEEESGTFPANDNSNNNEGEGDEAEMFPEGMDENELAFYTFKKQRVLQAMMQRVAACNPRGGERFLENAVIGNAWTREQAGEQPPADLDENGIAVWRVMKELKTRLGTVYTGDFVVVEAMGRKGLNDEKHKPTITFDHNAFNRHKLRDAVQERVSKIWTGDHYVVSNHDDKRDDKDGSNSSDEIFDDLNDSFANDFSSKTATSGISPTAKSPSTLTASLTDSFNKFESLLKKVQLEEDEYTECTISSVVEQEQPQPLPSTQLSTLKDSAGMLPSMPPQPVTPDDDKSVYTEYTLETVQDNNANNEGKEKSGCMEDSPARSKAMKNTEKALKSIGAFFGGAPVVADDDEYTEVTIENSAVNPAPVVNKPSSVDSGRANNAVNHSALVSDPPFRIAGQAQLPQAQDDQSYMEVTVKDEEDQESYAEVTVTDTVVSPPPLKESAYMSSMLSSRMFADMDLPPDLKRQQQQKQEKEASDYDDENYPTISFGSHHDTDDMTQITFDHDDWEEDNDMTQDHYHAQSYLEKKLDYSNHTTAGGMVSSPASIGANSRRSGQTDPTDDESSSHNGSFKSCLSTESSQSVAKLLRQDVWSKDAEVVGKALVKLGEVASQGYQHCLVITRYGGILAIIRAMDMNNNHVTVQIAACDALEKLTSYPDTQLAIGEVGGLVAIANAMKAHMDSVDMQKAACKVLASLTCHQERPSDQVPVEGIVEAISSSMTHHIGVAAIQANAFKALANLCMESTDRLKELSEVGGLAAMTIALQKQWPNKMDQHEAISTLSILLRTLAELDQDQ